MGNERSVRERFGGDWGWDMPDGCRVSIGDVICGEGPGQGFQMLPWMLDEYERALRLRPGEAWILRRMIAHAWEYRGVVFLSMSKITDQAMIARKTLDAYLCRLQNLGYIKLISNGAGLDRRKRWDVTGIYAALTLCAMANPASTWSQSHGGPMPLEWIETRGHTWVDGTLTTFDIDTKAIRKLARRKGYED